VGLLQIVGFLIAAAVGFGIGWLVRGARLQDEIDRLEGKRQARLRSAESARARLQAELGPAKAPSGATRSVATGDPRLEERAAELQRELDAARGAVAEQRSEIERLQTRVVELQAGAADARGALGQARRAVPAAAASSRTGQGSPPAALAAPEGPPDDLKKISGIGPGIEKTLHELGVFHFRQIAAFTPENVAWVNRRLHFKGRIERENWIDQARTLAAGEQAR
jgi:NADH-quinone oxidoreductase subunit E